MLAVTGRVHDRMADARPWAPYALVIAARLGAKHAQVF